MIEGNAGSVIVSQLSVAALHTSSVLLFICGKLVRNRANLGMMKGKLLKNDDYPE